jgi:hypothetical protein
MRIDLKTIKPLSKEFLHSLQSDLSGVWKSAATEFYARFVALSAHGKNPPLGMQPVINSQLNEMMVAKGWQGSSGRFIKDNVWLRITFRHQLSLGSDFMDALLVAHREQMQALVIAAPSIEFAQLITPRDFKAITTFDKLETYFNRAQDLYQVPLAIGRLEPDERLDSAIEQLLQARQGR